MAQTISEQDAADILRLNARSSVVAERTPVSPSSVSSSQTKFSCPPG
eukprot:gene9975-12657_t